MRKILSGKSESFILKRQISITLVNATGSIAKLEVGEQTVTATHTGTQTYGPFNSQGRAVITAVSGDVNYAAKIIANEAKQVVYSNGVLITDEGVPVAGGAGGVATLTEIVNSYEANRVNNARINATIRSVPLVSDVVYADTAAANTAFAAASNANKAAKVGTSGSYTINISDGTSYVATPNVVGYLNTGVSTTGYTNQLTTYPTNVYPDNNGFAPRRPIAMVGGIAVNASGNGYTGTCGWKYSTANVLANSTSRITFSTNEPKPIFGVQNAAYGHRITINDGTGFKTIVDPFAAPSNNGGSLISAVSANVGGNGYIQFDLSQIGGRKQRTFQLICGQQGALIGLHISALSTMTEVNIGASALLLTDSLGLSVKNGTVRDAYPNVLADYIGLHALFALSEGGTGFVADSSGTARTHIDKLKYAALLPQLKEIQFGAMQMSVNDGGQAPLVTRVLEAIAYARATWPRKYWFILGATAPSVTATQATLVADEVAVASAIAGLNDPLVVFIPLMSSANGQPIKGTGNTTTPVGDGNSDLLFDTGDQVHFNTFGHSYWARDVVAPALVGAMRKVITQ
jgi:hypothetical protein